MSQTPRRWSEADGPPAASLAAYAEQTERAAEKLPALGARPAAARGHGLRWPLGLALGLASASALGAAGYGVWHLTDTRHAAPKAAPPAAPSSSSAPVPKPVPKPVAVPSQPAPSPPKPIASGPATVEVPSSTAVSSLARESQALAEVSRALRRDRAPDAALLLLDAYRAEFPRGKLQTEATVLRIDALVALGRNAEALRILERLPLEHLPRRDELLALRARLRGTP